MGTIRAVFTTHMPKQVWQSEDGNTFATEEECVAYEQVAPHLQALLEGLGEEAEEKLGMQTGFGASLQTGFYQAGQLMDYRQSFQILVDVMHGRVKLN